MTTRARNRAGRAAIARLSAAATAVFGELGYNAAGVEEVVARAGMARSTFYEYFTGKDELFRELLTGVAEQMQRHAAAVPTIRADDESRRALRRWLAGFSDIYAANAGLLRAWSEAEVASESLGAFGPALYGEMTRALSAAMRAGGVRGVDTGAAAVAFVAMVERLNYYVAEGLLEGLDGDAAATLTDVVCDALFGDATGATE